MWPMVCFTSQDMKTIHSLCFPLSDGSLGRENFRQISPSKNSTIFCESTAPMSSWHNPPICPVVYESAESLFFRNDLLPLVVNCDVCNKEVRELISYALHSVHQLSVPWILVWSTVNTASIIVLESASGTTLIDPFLFHIDTTLCILAFHILLSETSASPPALGAFATLGAVASLPGICWLLPASFRLRNISFCTPNLF